MKRSALSLAIIGALASLMPSRHVVTPQTKAMRQAPASTGRVPSANNSAGMAKMHRLSQEMAAGPCFLGGPSRVQNFYLGVPRFRGYRNGRPRGRRSYRSHQR